MKLNLVDRLISFVPGKTLHVAFDTGKKQGSAVIFLHGIAATSNTWKPLIHKLDHKNHRIIALDILGFGGSPIPPKAKYSAEQHCTYIHRTLLKLRVKKPYILVGHSMGSILATHYASIWSNDVSKLILASLPLYDRGTKKASSKIPTDIYFRVYQFFRKNRKFTINSSRALRKILRIPDGIDVSERNWPAFKYSLSNTIEKQNTFKELRKIKMPTTIIVGRQDEFSVNSTLKTASKFDNVHLKIIPLSDHAINSRIANAIIHELKLN